MFHAQKLKIFTHQVAPCVHGEDRTVDAAKNNVWRVLGEEEGLQREKEGRERRKLKVTASQTVKRPKVNDIFVRSDLETTTCANR